DHGFGDPGRGGLALPGTAAPGTAGTADGAMAGFRERAPHADLPAHAGRGETPGGGSFALGRICRRGGADFASQTGYGVTHVLASPIGVTAAGPAPKARPGAG